MVMPIGRYIAWVGTSLLVLLFVADWYFPNPFHDGPRDAIDKPIIRIASIRQPPERIVIDTSEPTIVPPPTLVSNTVPVEPSPLQSYAATGPPQTVVDLDKKRKKIIKQQRPKVASSGLPPVAEAATRRQSYCQPRYPSWTSLLSSWREPC